LGLVFFENNEEKSYIAPTEKEAAEISIERLLKGNCLYTNSVLYRTQDYSHLPNNVMPHDWYIHLYHAQFGKIGYINRVIVHVGSGVFGAGDALG
jgi:hypothetical protein